MRSSYQNAISQEFIIGFSQIPRNPLGFIAAWRCHYEIIEATLWSLDSTAAPRELSEGYFIPEHDEEIDQVAVSQSLSNITALFDPYIPFRAPIRACAEARMEAASLGDEFLFGAWRTDHA